MHVNYTTKALHTMPRNYCKTHATSFGNILQFLTDFLQNLFGKIKPTMIIFWVTVHCCEWLNYDNRLNAQEVQPRCSNYVTWYSRETTCDGLANNN